MWRMWRPIHSSWRIALGCAAFVGGVAVSLVLHPHPFVGLMCFCIACCLLFIRFAWALMPITLSFFITGAAYGSLHVTHRSIYQHYNNQSVIGKGRLKEDSSITRSGTVSLQLDHVVFNDVELPGTVLASHQFKREILRGDVVTFQGIVKPGLGSFPATVTIEQIIKVERESFGDIGRVVRDGFADKVRAVIPEPQASLGVGFLTGQKSTLAPELAEAMKIAGLTHIVVASGYNLTILVRMARKLFVKVSKYISALSSSLMILGFMTITGLSPSMTRAGLVSGMSLLAWYYGRAFHPFVILPLAASLTVVVQPSYVWGDLGWQLSFAAFAGVMIVAPLLQVYFFGPRPPGTAQQILGETIAAHLVTLPIIAINFGTVSHVAIIANMLVVPFVPLAMLLTFLTGIASLASFPFIDVLTQPTTWLLGYMTHIATFVAELPWSQSLIEFPVIVWVAYGGGLSIGCLWMWQKTKYNFRSGEPAV